MIIKLKEIAEIRGRVGWKGYTINDLTDNGPLVLGANDIDEHNALNLSSAKHLTREKFEESPEIMIQKNDILVVKVGSTIGKVCIIDKEIGEASINPNCVIVRAKNINSHYLYYFLCSPAGKSYLLNNSSSSAQSALNQKDLGNFKLELPCIEKQNKIAKVLNAFDNQIKKNNEMVQKLQCFKPASNFSENGGMRYVG